ncbi:MAG TPA: sensor domain-containing diguanylate cyclase [Anaerolineaceae bacterium]|nr:sensor domain-containing diguanylate cyclase [Anaerolineaceae bacterium]
MHNNDSFFKNLIENLFEGIYFVDCERRITYWNKSAERIAGYSTQHIVGKLCPGNTLNHVDDQGNLLCHDGCPLAATIQDGNLRKLEVYLQHKDGYRVPVVVHTSPILDDAGNIVGAVESFTDNKDLFLSRKKIQTLTKELEVDKLTGVGSRRSTNLRIRSALSELRSTPGKIGLIFIDIDHFKSINDSYGHEIGDEVLASIAQTMRGSLRSTDFLGRWGGEEFVTLIYETDPFQLKIIAEKLRSLVASSSTNVNGSRISVTISGGATILNEFDTSNSVLDRADCLLYQSKANGRNTITFG